jgi:hypothetical protein
MHSHNCFVAARGEKEKIARPAHRKEFCGCIAAAAERRFAASAVGEAAPALR